MAYWDIRRRQNRKALCSSMTAIDSFSFFCNKDALRVDRGANALYLALAARLPTASDGNIPVKNPAISVMASLVPQDAISSSVSVRS